MASLTTQISPFPGSSSRTGWPHVTSRYVQQSREEMEILFTFLAERYERRTVIITSNLVFSQWDKIFKDPMTTAAAIDRIVHHATIIELDGPSIRSEVAKRRNGDRTAGASADEAMTTGEK